MKIVGTPQLNSLLLYYSELFETIMWDAQRHDCWHMIEKQKPDLVLLDEQTAKMLATINALTEHNIPAVCITPRDQSEFCFDCYHVPEKSTPLIIKGGKRINDVKYNHDVVMFLHSGAHSINVNRLTKICSELKQYKFGLFGDQAITANYKGRPSMQDQANLIRNAAVTITTSEAESMIVAINRGNALTLYEDSELYPEYDEKSLKRALSKKSQPKTWLEHNLNHALNKNGTLPDHCTNILKKAGPESAVEKMQVYVKELKEGIINNE